MDNDQTSHDTFLCHEELFVLFKKRIVLWEFTGEVNTMLEEETDDAWFHPDSVFN